MNSFTHKRKDYRITAICLKHGITLSNGMKGDVGDFFVCDEEGEQYIMPKERMEKDYDDIAKIRVKFTPDINVLTQTLGSGGSLEINPSRYTIHQIAE